MGNFARGGGFPAEMFRLWTSGNGGKETGGEKHKRTTSHGIVKNKKL